MFCKGVSTLRDSVYTQFEFAISIMQADALFKKTKSSMEITYLPTGQKVLFRGLDEAGKIKSIKAPFGYFRITHFEEMDQYHGREEIRNVLQSTMRGRDGRFWNFKTFHPPISQSNWANKDLLIERDDRLLAKSCYLDVPKDWLSEQFFNEAEFLKELNERAYRHEYLGKATGTGSNVFENVKIRTITDKLIGTGVSQETIDSYNPAVESHEVEEARREAQLEKEMEKQKALMEPSELTRFQEVQQGEEGRDGESELDSQDSQGNAPGGQKTVD